MEKASSYSRFFIVTHVNVWEGCYCSNCVNALSKEGESFVRKLDSECVVTGCCDYCGEEIPPRLDVEGLQGFLENEYLNLRILLDDTKLTFIFTPPDRMSWDSKEIANWIKYYTGGEVSGVLSDVHSRFDSDCNEHFVYLTFDLGGE